MDKKTQPLILAPSEGRVYDWSSDRVVVKTPADLSEGRVTVVEDTLKPGFHLKRHHHRGMLEVFYILDGEVTFTFDDSQVIATPGMTVNIPPQRWHDVRTSAGGRLLTIFSPGGFDRYLSDLTDLSPQDLEDPAVLTALSQRYDIWME